MPDWFQISFQMAPDSHNPFFRKAPALATEDFSQNLDFFKLRGSQLVDALREAISSPRLKRRWLATSSFGQDSVWITADATPEEIAERKEAARRRHWIMRDRPKIPVFNDD
ncbi:MAG: hypothetical protein KGL39_03980 [Patescibacteria group bacterium]|nr:hypothetical protein [Patescibacteria group bacterium]